MARDRVARGNADEWFLDLQDGVDRVRARVEMARLWEPCVVEAELPGVVTSLAHEKVTIDGELQLQRWRGNPVNGNDEVAHLMMERQCAPLFIGDAADIERPHRSVGLDDFVTIHVEAKDVLSRRQTGKRFGNVRLRIVAICGQREIKSGQHERRFRRGPVVVPNRLAGKHPAEKPLLDALVAAG